jgi:hypothetical protein
LRLSQRTGLRKRSSPDRASKLETAERDLQQAQEQQAESEALCAGYAVAFLQLFTITTGSELVGVSKEQEGPERPSAARGKDLHENWQRFT